MRHLIYFAAICATALLSAGSSAEQCPKPPEKSPPKQQSIQMADQHDQTDIFAIPLDTSEAEEEQEMKELNKQETKG